MNNAPAIINKNILDVQVERDDFARVLNDLRKDKKFTDVQLQIGDKLFDAHRVVLSYYSPVLEAAISDQWSTSKICQISDQYVDPSIVEPLLHFLYTGRIDLTPDNVHPVCVAAHFLQIKDLLEKAVQHLCRLITVENVISVFELSVNCDLKPLRYLSLRVIAKNHDRIFRDPRIYNFSNRMFNELIAGLKERSRSWTTFKERTFETIAYWTAKNLSERSKELPGLLKNIPLENLSFYFLSKTVSRHRLVKESITCIQTVSTALGNIPSQRKDNLVVFDQKGESITCYDTQTKAWRRLPRMLEPRSNFAATVVNRKDIIVCGGASYSVAINGYIQINIAEMFEWSSQTWKKLPEMPFPSAYCSMAFLNDQLYVIGHSTVHSKAVACYSFETQQWRKVKPMSIARKDAKLVEYDGYLYVFGGLTEIVERYDPVLDEWTSFDEESNDSGEISVRKVAVHENKIHVYGSFSCYEFNPQTEKWNYLGPSSEGSLALLNGQVLVAKKDTKWIHKLSGTRKWYRFLELEEKDCHLLAGPFY